MDETADEGGRTDDVSWVGHLGNVEDENWAIGFFLKRWGILGCDNEVGVLKG